MHKVVRKVKGKALDHYMGSLPEARRFVAKWKGEIWVFCPIHGWVPGEKCGYMGHSKL